MDTLVKNNFHRERKVCRIVKKRKQKNKAGILRPPGFTNYYKTEVKACYWPQDRHID